MTTATDHVVTPEQACARDVVHHARRVSVAGKVHAATPSDATWFALRTAVDGLAAAVPTLAAHPASTAATETIRDAATLLSEAAAMMNADSGRRLSPGAEDAAQAALERAGAVLADGMAALARESPPETDRPPTSRRTIGGPRGATRRRR